MKARREHERNEREQALRRRVAKARAMERAADRRGRDALVGRKHQRGTGALPRAGSLRSVSGTQAAARAMGRVQRRARRPLAGRVEPANRNAAQNQRLPPGAAGEAAGAVRGGGRKTGPRVPRRTGGAPPGRRAGTWRSWPSTAMRGKARPGSRAGTFPIARRTRGCRSRGAPSAWRCAAGSWSPSAPTPSRTDPARRLAQGDQGQGGGSRARPREDQGAHRRGGRRPGGVP